MKRCTSVSERPAGPHQSSAATENFRVSSFPFISSALEHFSDFHCLLLYKRARINKTHSEQTLCDYVLQESDLVVAPVLRVANEKCHHSNENRHLQHLPRVALRPHRGR